MEAQREPVRYSPPAACLPWSPPPRPGAVNHARLLYRAGRNGPHVADDRRSGLGGVYWVCTACCFVMLAIFIAGLMIGRTEYLGRIRPRMKMIAGDPHDPDAGVLGTAMAMTQAGRAGMFNLGLKSVGPSSAVTTTAAPLAASARRRRSVTRWHSACWLLSLRSHCPGDGDCRLAGNEKVPARRHGRSPPMTRCLSAC